LLADPPSNETIDVFYIKNYFFMVRQLLVGQGLPIVEAS